MTDRPEVLGVSRTADTVTLALRIPPELPCLPHHFPAIPIVPGVVQLGWAIAYAAEHLGLRGDFQALTALKFQRPLLPRAQVRLSLTRLAPREFSFAYDGYSAGRVGLA